MFCASIRTRLRAEAALHRAVPADNGYHPRRQWDLYFAQHGEDRFLVENALVPAKGLFIDVGAEDGISLSNTFFFERTGWTGFLIEPNPKVALFCRMNRRSPVIQAAIGSDPTLKLNIHPIRGWSGLLDEGRGTKVDVEIYRLDDLLLKLQVPSIDLLSIDTEGTEIDVMSTLDMEKYQPKIIIVEYHTWEGKLNTESELMSYFSDRPYTMIHKTPGNLIFKRN